MKKRKGTIMRKVVFVITVLILGVSASAAVRIIVENDGTIKYENTNGEHVRAFALDVTVSKGTIDDVTDFVVGESTAANPGYGIFPAAFSQFIEVDAETGEVIAWDVNDYKPVADPCDCPDDTLLGLGTSGITLEMGALYSPAGDDSLNAPGDTGTLCKLVLSDAADVTVTTNTCRGGIVLTDPTQEAVVDISDANSVAVIAGS
jgi:hypothetical protein